MHSCSQVSVLVLSNGLLIVADLTAAASMLWAWVVLFVTITKVNFQKL